MNGNPEINRILQQYEGQRINGGCDSCNAYQEIWRDPNHPAIWHITISHDDWCPEHPADPTTT
jgi:hypothetical protein